MSFAFVNKLGEKVSKSYNDPYDAYYNQIKKKLCLVKNKRVIYILDTRMIFVKWAVLCAKHVLHIFEEQYPDDKKPRKIIEAALNWINDPSEKNKKACLDAAYYAALNLYYPPNDVANAVYYAISHAAYDNFTAVNFTLNAAANAALDKSLEIKWQRKKLNQIVYEEILLAFAMTQYQRKDNKLVRKIPKELLEYIASYLTMS